MPTPLTTAQLIASLTARRRRGPIKPSGVTSLNAGNAAWRASKVREPDPPRKSGLKPEDVFRQSGVYVGQEARPAQSAT